MIFDPIQWEKPTPREMSDFLRRPKSSNGKATGSLLVFRKHLSPLSVYKYLVARFGQPYGFQTMAKKPNNSDNLFHWDFLGHVDKWRTQRRIEVMSIKPR